MRNVTVGLVSLFVLLGCGDDFPDQPAGGGGAGGMGGAGNEGGVGNAGAGGAGNAGGGTGNAGGDGGAPGDLVDGSACTNDGACAGGFCLAEDLVGWGLGYCTEVCNDLVPCSNPDSACIDIGAGQFCLASCDPVGPNTCGEAQACFDLGDGTGVCGPGCTEDDHCPVLGKCTIDGICVEPEQCTDGDDNDGDGFTDCEDDDCTLGCAGDIDAACTGATAAMATQMGDTTGGTGLFAGSCTGAGGALEDIYTYTPTQDAILRVTLGSASDQGVYVRTTCDDWDTEIACLDEAFGGDPEVLYLQGTTGTALTIFVDGFNTPAEAGPYTLDIEELVPTPEGEPNHNAGTADPATDAFAGSINPEADEDWIAVTVGAGQSLTATVTAGGADTCGPNGAIDSEIEIIDTDGSTSLAFNDDLGFASFCSSATADMLAGGTYYVRVAASAQFCPTCTFDYSVILDIQ